MRGQSAVEFGLILPILIVLLAGTIDVGRLLFAAVAIEEAAQEGAFFAAYRPCSEADVIGRVTSSSSTEEVAGAEVHLLADTPDAGLITVTAEYDYPLITPIIQNLLGSTVHIGSSVTGTMLSTCP
jgi:Flp pilus assembly protein TadG